MTVINPNSISGIASVTAQGDIIQFYKSDGTLGAVQFDGANFNTTSGVSTFKNLYVGGTLTYEDVKNVDSVGIVTARDGIKVTGGTLNVTNSENTLGILSSTDDGANLDLWDNDTQSRIRTVDGRLHLYADFGNDVADSAIRFFVDGSNERLRITNDGKVGIGSQIPADTFDVHGNPIFGSKSTADAQLQLGRTGSGNRNAYIDLVGDDTYSDHGLRIIRKNAGPNSESQITHRGTGDFTINTNEAAALRFGTTATERLRIESGGKIAIGNHTGATHDIHIKHANSPGIKLEDTTQSSKLLFFAQDANTGIGNFSNHDLVFYTNSTPVFRIDIDGRVGIGTDDADALLHLQSADARLRWTSANAAADNKDWDLGPISGNILRLQAKSDAGGGGGNLFDFHRSGNQITEFRGMKAGAYWFIIDNNNQRVGIGTDDPDADGLLTLHTDADDECLIRFDMGSPTQRRPWAFKQKDTGSSTDLRLQALSNGKTFCVTNSSDTDHFSVHTGSADSYIRMHSPVRLDDEIVHTGDDDTKIKFPAVGNNISFETAGSEALRIDSNQRVMIGSTSSGGWKFRVQVPDNSSYQSAFNITNNVNADLQFEIKSSESRFGPSTNTPLVFKTGNTEKLRIDSSGNICGAGGVIQVKHPTGSGNVTVNMLGTSGDARLDLESTGNGNYSGIDFVRERASGTGVVGGAIFMKSDTSSNLAHLYIQAQSASAQSPVTSALVGNNGVRLLLEGGSGKFGISNGDTERFILNAAGGCHIGLPATTSTWDTHAIALTTNSATFACPGTVSIFGGTGFGTANMAGGGIRFVGYYTASALTTFAHVAGVKENTTSGDYGGALTFHTRTNGTLGAERLRISSTGRTYINTTSPIDGNSTVAIRGAFGSAGCGVEIKHQGNQGSNRDFIRFYNVNSAEAGSIEHNASTSVAFRTSSDYRLKENIVDITDGIERLKLLKPRKFSWIEDPELGLRDGFIAHEVSPVIPHCVSGEKDAVKDNGKMQTQTIEYSQLTPLLTAALQEAIAKIEDLESKVAALEGS